jgi:ribA/ribD-fused uncharacterized protein
MNDEYYLFLDDERLPSTVTWVDLPQVEWWVIVETYEKFVAEITKRGLPKFIAFDHDLHDEHYQRYFKAIETKSTEYNYSNLKVKTGYQCAEWLVQYCRDKGLVPPPFVCHSRNVYGVLNINKLLIDFQREMDALMDIDWELSNYLPNAKEEVEVPSFATHDFSMVGGFFGQYRFLSNFYPSAVTYLGMRFESVEAAYQAAKSLDPKERAKFTYLDARNAKQFGKLVKLRDDWEHVKNDVMGFLVMQKFNNDKELRQQLLATGNRKLIESNNWKDRYWGINYYPSNTFGVWDTDGGQNHLGKILERVRAAFRA